MSFRIKYKVTIDWATANLSDQCIIWLNPSTEGLYPSIPAPRNTYLSQLHIGDMLDVFAFSSEMHRVFMTEHLKYPSRKAAVSVLESASGVENLGEGEVYYRNPGFDEDPGYPMLRTFAEIKPSNNECLSCSIDLVTGKTVVINEPCVIYFCFEKGTPITVTDNKTVPIDKIKPGNKVISMNPGKWTLEEVIVLKMDSVRHSNMISVSFSPDL